MEKLRPLELKYEPNQFAGVIVMGARLNKEVLSLPGIMRAHAAGDLLNAEVTPFVILSGGRSFPNQPTEAEMMRQYIETNFPKVSPDRILLEIDSSSTVTNLKYSKRIAQARQVPFDELGVLTNTYHLQRTLGTARKVGLNDIKPIRAEPVLTHYDLTWQNKIDQFYRSPQGLFLILWEMALRGIISPADFIQRIQGHL